MNPELFFKRRISLDAKGESVVEELSWEEGRTMGPSCAQEENNRNATKKSIRIDSRWKVRKCKTPFVLSFTADIADKRFDLLPPEGPVVISFSFRVGHRDAEHPAFLPAAWCQRLWKYGRELLRRSDSAAGDSVRLSQQRAALLKELQIIE